ncbi:hypothetical protein CEXT_512401 [Caerostris extrusa]|uniref:Uncharacterized protein n=1 Tax=Caerostris extrusa TaxID=172846 RepID=A0AAV4XXW1_CAEEX|nr:hypothetical protein CEXT_512401 [Caerostris extrusa]
MKKKEENRSNCNALRQAAVKMVVTGGRTTREGVRCTSLALINNQYANTPLRAIKSYDKSKKQTSFLSIAQRSHNTRTVRPLEPAVD